MEKTFLPILEKERKVETSVLNLISPDDLKELIELDGTIFSDMSIPLEELEESLKSNGVQIIQRDSSNKIVGYLTSLPQDQAVKFLFEDDNQIKPDKDFLYIESIGILPDYRSLENLLNIYNTLIEEARKKGYKKITGHFRVNEHLSDVAQKRIGAKFIRRYDNWAGFNEPFDYLEIDL